MQIQLVWCIMAILLIFEIPNIERELCLHEIWCESLILRRSWVLCSFCPHRNQKTYEQAKVMFSGFSTKTRTSVNGFPHADPAVRARTHPARASVQRSSRLFPCLYVPFVRLYCIVDQIGVQCYLRDMSGSDQSNYPFESLLPGAPFTNMV